MSKNDNLFQAASSIGVGGSRPRHHNHVFFRFRFLNFSHSFAFLTWVKKYSKIFFKKQTRNMVVRAGTSPTPILHKLKNFPNNYPFMENFHGWMARDSSCAVRDGKSDTIRTMDKKMNTINKKILENLEQKIQENLSSLRLSVRYRKKHTTRILDWLQDDSELLHELRKFYRYPDTVKMSKNLKNEKMLHEIEFYKDLWFDDKHNEEWDKRFMENLDIRKPCRNPLHFKNLMQKLIKF